MVSVHSVLPSGSDLVFRRFPKARVWPPLPREASTVANATPCSLDNDMDIDLPEPSVQDHLIELYFTYVHASFPILHKSAFWETYRRSAAH